MKLILKSLSRLSLILTLLISLSFNGILLVSATAFDFASSFAELIVGKNTVRHRNSDEVARLSAELEKKDRLTQELNHKTAQLSADLAAAQSANKRVRQSVKNISDRVAARTTKAAARESAAMAGEAVPFWGVAVIVTATALELNDFCQTLLDMNELEAIFDPRLGVKEEDLSVCGMTIPSKEELWESVSSAPGNAWQATRKAMPTLDDLSNFEVPSIDWKATTDDVKERTTSIFSKWDKWLTDEAENID